MSMSGLRLAAVFGFYPNKLGFCGSQQPLDKKILFSWLCGKKISEQKIRKILQGFEGAFPYYQLIAKSNNISDPFAQKVVKAYWLGNEFLEKVPLTDFKKMVAEKFSKRGLLAREVAQKKASQVPFNSIPHHSFHVLFIGSVTGRIVLTGKALDFCRVGWGQVLKKSKINPFNILRVDSEQSRSVKEQPQRSPACGGTLRGKKSKIIIKYQALIKKDKKFKLGGPKRKEIFWDKFLVPKVKIGDWVAIHWNHAVRVLKMRDVSNLKKYTQITIESLKG